MILKKLVFSIVLFMILSWSSAQNQVDIIIIGGGAGGTSAGIQASRMGAHVQIVEATPWLGGMLTSAGVSAIDGNHDMPSFVVGLDIKVEVPGIGEVIYDLAYGGAFYAYVDMKKNSFNFDLSAKSYRQLIQAGMDIKQAVVKNDSGIKHPFESDLSFLYGTIFIGDSNTEGLDSKNVCIFAEGEVDRCPTGSGVSGRMAIHKARNEINFGETMTIESITGSVFKGSVVSEEDYGPFHAVIPQVEGTAHITGMHTFCIDPDDPMKIGFILR